MFIFLETDLSPKQAVLNFLVTASICKSNFRELQSRGNIYYLQSIWQVARPCLGNKNNKMIKLIDSHWNKNNEIFDEAWAADAHFRRASSVQRCWEGHEGMIENNKCWWSKCRLTYRIWTILSLNIIFNHYIGSWFII